MPKRLWKLLQEPRAVTATMAVSWMIGLGIGAVTVLSPPTTLTGALGHMTIVMGCLMLIGSAFGVTGCLSGWWWVERCGVIAAGTGTAIYASTLIVIQYQQAGSRLTQLGFILLVVCFLITRWLRIQGAQVDPTRGREPR